MSNSIIRDTLSLSTGHVLRYSLFHEATQTAHPTPLLICLHPGWSDDVPPAYFGEEFLSSLFLPAFSDIGARIVAPDCPGGAWNNPRSLLAILALIDHLKNQFAIDTRQVSLVGYSAGGRSAWYFMQESPNSFASAIMLATMPVIDPADNVQQNILNTKELLSHRLAELALRIPELPIYIIHSQNDEVFPHAQAMLVYQAISKVRKKVEYHPIKGSSHHDSDSYVPALRGAAPWLINSWKRTSNS
jgi:pimeloyl-ACP methyl ester carboxylesterase